MLQLSKHGSLSSSSLINLARKGPATKRIRFIKSLLHILAKFMKKKLRYLMSFFFAYHYQRKKLMSYLLVFYVLHQIRSHRVWWSGIADSSQLALLYLQTYHQIKFDKQEITAKDGEKYCIWFPASNKLIQIQCKSKKKHIWICLPGGMFDIDPGVVVIARNNLFSGSEFVCFNNPGISTKMKQKPLIPPTETLYLIEYITNLYNDGYDISLIGFSIGTVLALRTLHTLQNKEIYSEIKLKSLVLVHAPDIVREAVVSAKNNWFFRLDLYFAFHIQWLQYQSGSWNMIKHKINYNWLNGWKFIQNCTEVCSNKEWTKCEDEELNLRSFCDSSISNVPILRIIAKNDFVIPFQQIDQTYFKYLTKVLICDRGGHCGINNSKQTMNAIKNWNLKYDSNRIA